jgi:hypothetical protein
MVAWDQFVVGSLWGFVEIVVLLHWCRPHLWAMTKPVLTAFFTLFSFFLHAQTVISGIIADKLGKEPLAGASVSIKDGLDGTTTDSLGRFKFTTDETGPITLVVAYFGYKSLELPLQAEAAKTGQLKIFLEESLTNISEVVISAGAFEASDEKKGVVLNPIDIVTIPGANGDIPGALNTLPGTTVNGETGQLIVRGGAASETRVYIDGLAVRNFYTSALPDVPARSRFSPFQFKGTTFSSGGYSAAARRAAAAGALRPSPGAASPGMVSVRH